MIVFPAIDIKDGKCVRLTQGRFDQQTVFSDIPGEMAIKWQQEGAEYLHLVDLDGALTGVRKNIETIRELLYLTNVPVQFGGGVRDIASIETMLEFGIKRVVLGSVAISNPALVKEACQKYGEQIAVGIDARANEVAVEGWSKSGGVKADELAKQMADAGVQRIIFTDIERDGKLSGINAEEAARIARGSGLKVIASGGASSLADIERLKKYEADGIEGVIIGKAIYTGILSLADAIKAARGE
ncbi:MAG: 1-(5-phosphoribosyl)-5-[(5-phosphoribosylamino)methylideneamino]imidazole-4-carboxamide isomerase [Acidaminococcales bacterium]|jgi:phosphoribosylformimino-5-aminoimidazole carboxamide ribotide isomerase|nr:1-(5-phosphoribosyl)-5-[(5-phosphoribosylamino)methylideneamino]imidazole-4-carboxamide isomerase [Acidaminococcales bacterium]